MSWSEFCTLLSGIMPKTPLGQIVEIRSEEDPERLKHFTPEQHEIRNDWMSKQFNRQLENMSKEELEEQMNNIQSIFAKAFG